MICKKNEWIENECFCFHVLGMNEAVENYNPVTDRYFSMIARPTMWGEHQAIAFYMSDITNSKKKDMEIAEKNEQLRKVQEESIRAYKRQLDTVMQMNRDALATCRMNLSKNTCYNGNSKYPNLEKLYSIGTVDGYCQTALHFMEQTDIAEIKFQPSCQGFLEAFKAGQTTLVADCRYKIAEGDERYVRTTVLMAENPITHDVEAGLYIEDITRRKLENRIIKQLVDQHYEVIAVTDVQHRKTMVYQYTYNEEFHMLNCPLDSQETVALFADKYLLPEEKETYKEKFSIETITRELKRNRTYSFMFHLINETHETRLKTVSFYKLYDDCNQVLGLIEDITEVTQKQREHMEELRKEKLKADQAVEAKMAFFSNISHDMRTPLNGILGFTQLALESQKLEDCQECLKKIQSSGEFLLKLINDTLDISKIENGSVKLVPEAFPANKAVKEVIDAIEETANEKGVKLVVELPENDGKYIYADKLRLQQIFTNLLGNAVKFTPKDGTVEFVVQRLDFIKYGTNYKITVKDNGIGMKKEFVPYAFEAFSQQEEMPMQAAMGTGLGLAIVKQLVDLMNGHIDLETEEGKGTKYEIYLPLQFVSENISEPEVKNTSAIELTGKKILLCEDHPINRELAVRLLKNKGMVVTCAENGRIGVTLFSESQEGFFDAILMDIRMPEMDGLEAAKEIRKMKRKDAKTIPIIAMTANAFATDKQESISAGMNAHLTKPLIPVKMYETLADEIAKSQN